MVSGLDKNIDPSKYPQDVINYKHYHNQICVGETVLEWCIQKVLIMSVTMYNVHVL